MSRPVKYKTEAERSEAVKVQNRERQRRHRVKRDKKDVTENNIDVTQNITQNSSKNYKLLYELLKREYKELEDKYKALLYESEITNEYCRELEEQLNEAKDMGY